MTFWAISGALALLVAATLVFALFRRGAVEGSTESDLGVYRDQLREVERDLARGVVSDTEAAQVRLEVSRRLLDADRTARTEAAGDGSAPRWAVAGGAVAVALVVVGGALAIYARVGAPGYPDLPLDRRIALAEEARASRPTQAEAEARFPVQTDPGASPEFLDLLERLRAAVAERPDDAEGLVFLARNEAQLGDFPAAWRAWERVVALKGDEATADDHAALADLMVMAAGGYVSPEAEAAVNRALARDRGHGTARYFSGLLAVQTGRPDEGFRIWRPLLENSPPDAPWVPPVRARIVELARLAGVDYVLPPPPAGAAPGPTAADMEAAAGMSPADRMEMIRGMVDGLSQRLATEGGPPADWARLIRALGVLGQRDRAAAIWDEAQRVFPDDIARVPILQAARAAGVAQ